MMAAEDDRYAGFDFGKVTWAYRDLLRSGIDTLYRRDLLGPGRAQASRSFFALLNDVCGRGDGYMVKSVMAALTGPGGWILGMPPLFREWTRLGRLFTGRAFYMGNGYFSFWTRDDAADPVTVRKILSHTAFIADAGVPVGRSGSERDALIELAYAFLTNYPVIERHCPRRKDKDELIRTALDIHARNRSAAREFFTLRTGTARTYARRITADVRLEEVEPLLGRITAAMAGACLPVTGLGELDADYLLECGSYLVAGKDGIYFPHHFSLFDDRKMNREYALICAMLAAVDYRHRGFTYYHGRPGAETGRAFLHTVAAAGASAAGYDLFRSVEALRILTLVRNRYPGLFLRFEKVHRALRGREPDASSSPERTVRQWLAGEGQPDLMALAAAAGSAEDTARGVERLAGRISAGMTGQTGVPLRYFPDFNFPLQPDSPGQDTGRAAGESAGDGGRSGDDGGHSGSGIPGVGMPGKTGDWSPAGREYLYDEWDFLRRDYYTDWCRLYEMRYVPAEMPDGSPPYADEGVRGQAVRRMFEQLAPAAMGPEKRREDGDDITMEHLVEYLCDRRVDPGSRPAFYEKRIKRRRDVAVSLLLDASASTNNAAHGRKSVLEVEKEAACALCEGLTLTGDRFSVGAFSGTGRSQVQFFRIKDYKESWTDDGRHRLSALHAVSSTRIGPALRHAGAQLAKQPARTRILIIITDGEPTDSEYEYRNSYAQHDVRKAVEELHARDIHCFCLGTRVGDPRDLEIMFPGRRFAVIKKVRDLYAVLPRIYLRLAG